MSKQPTGIQSHRDHGRDIKKHIAFFADVLGFPLVALYRHARRAGGLHAFMRMNDYGTSRSCSSPPSIRSRSRSDRTHAARGRCLGSRDPPALGLPRRQRGRAARARDRVRNHGINVNRSDRSRHVPLDLLCRTDQLTLEIATSSARSTPRAGSTRPTREGRHLGRRSGALRGAPSLHGARARSHKPVSRPVQSHMSIRRRCTGRSSDADDVITQTASYAEPPVPAPGRAQKAS
jgi:hypothetical protein